MSIRCDCRATIVLHYNHIMIMMIMNIVKVECVGGASDHSKGRRRTAASTFMNKNLSYVAHIIIIILFLHCHNVQVLPSGWIVGWLVVAYLVLWPRFQRQLLYAALWLGGWLASWFADNLDQSEREPSQRASSSDSYSLPARPTWKCGGVSQPAARS